MKLPEIFLRIGDKKGHKGFTSLELIVVLGLMLLLVAASAPLYSGYYTRTQLSQTEAQIIQVLRQAQVSSQGNLEDSEWGVFVNAQSGGDSIVLYKGSSYLARDTSFDNEFNFDEVINLSSDFTDNDIHFTGGDGLPEETGQITVTHEVQGESTITVNSLGLIN